MMSWLQFEKYPTNFTFIYNKADLLEEEERDQALFQMCGMLEAGAKNLTCNRHLFPSAIVTGTDGSVSGTGIEETKKAMKLQSAIGFAPHCTYEDSKADLFQLLDSTFIPIQGKGRSYHRIPLHMDACNIL